MIVGDAAAPGDRVESRALALGASMTAGSPNTAISIPRLARLSFSLISKPSATARFSEDGSKPAAAATKVATTTKAATTRPETTDSGGF